MPDKVTSRLLTGDITQDKKTLRILLVNNETTPTKIASELGVSSQAVSQVIHRVANNRRVIEYLENLPIQV